MEKNYMMYNRFLAYNLKHKPFYGANQLQPTPVWLYLLQLQHYCKLTNISKTEKYHDIRYQQGAERKGTKITEESQNSDHEHEDKIASRPDLPNSCTSTSMIVKPLKHTLIISKLPYHPMTSRLAHWREWFRNQPFTIFGTDGWNKRLVTHIIKLLNKDIKHNIQRT